VTTATELCDDLPIRDWRIKIVGETARLTGDGGRRDAAA
jgi:hypothetical protein